MRARSIGAATVYCGDCREVLPHVLHEVEAVVTDPPYGTGGWRRLSPGQGSDPAARLARESWDDGAVDWVAGLFPLPLLTFWPSSFMPRIMAALDAAGYTKFRMLYMRKRDPKPQFAGRIAWSVEPIVVASLEGFQLYGGTDVIDTSTPRPGHHENEAHPYQKPLDAMNWLIAKTAAACICDPFMGSGSTGVAALTQGRRFVGIESDPVYFDLACRRLEDAQRQQRLGEAFTVAPARAEQSALFPLP